MKPQFLRSADQLDRWLEQFNPLQGLTLGTLASYLNECAQGRYTNTMWLARKFARREPTIRALLTRIRATLQKMEWGVKLLDELPKGIDEATAEQQKQHLENLYSQIDNVSEAIAWLGAADYYEFAHLEMHFTGDAVTHLEPVPQYHMFRKGIYGTWRFMDKPLPWPRDDAGIEIDPQTWIVRESDLPWLEIALIRALDKNQGTRDLRGFLARYGIPNTFFVAPQGATPEQIKEFQAIANDIASDGRGVLPGGTTVETADAGQKGEIFEKYFKHLDEEMVLAATGGVLTMLTQSGSGTLAGGAHTDTWDEIVSGLAREVAEVFQEQLDKPALAAAFPNQPIAAYFDICLPEKSEAADKTASMIASLKSAGYVVKKEWIEERLDVELEEEADAKQTAEMGKQKPGDGTAKGKGNGPDASAVNSNDPNAEDAALKNRDGNPKSAIPNPPSSDPAFMRLVNAMASDMKPVRDVLEEILNASDDELTALMNRLKEQLPDLATEVFKQDASEEVIRDLAAVEWFKGAAGQ